MRRRAQVRRRGGVKGAAVNSGSQRRWQACSGRWRGGGEAAEGGCGGKRRQEQACGGERRCGGNADASGRRAEVRC